MKTKSSKVTQSAGKKGPSRALTAALAAVESVRAQVRLAKSSLKGLRKELKEAKRAAKKLRKREEAEASRARKTRGAAVRKTDSKRRVGTEVSPASSTVKSPKRKAAKKSSPSASVARGPAAPSAVAAADTSAPEGSQQEHLPILPEEEKSSAA